MKVIFLDIDGCLSHSLRDEDLYHDHFADKDIPVDEDNLAAFKSVVDRVPDAKVVWSTDWRFFDEPLWHDRWKNPRLYLESLPWMAGRVVGKTPCKMSSEHFHDIKWWLDDHPGVDRYVVIEDSYFPAEWFGIERHVVKCDPGIGLTAEGADEAVRLLTEPPRQG